jgi:putative transposase
MTLNNNKNLSKANAVKLQKKNCDKFNFVYWCQFNQISIATEKLIDSIRNSPPSRRVKSGSKSVSGKFPSRKMGVTIQFESHKNELPYIYELEHDENVLEYYDQPQPIKLVYSNKNKNLGVMHTPDFFVIYQDSAGYVECKTEEELLKLAVKSSNRYQLDENGEWICPPGIECAKQLGLTYELRSNKKINWNFQRNIEFLSDYFRCEKIDLAENVYHLITETVKKEPAITLAQLIEKTSNIAEADDIYTLIAFVEIYVDLQNDLLTEPENVRVFINQETAEAYSNISNLNQQNNVNNEIEFKPNLVRLEPNAEIIWDGKGWKILNVGEKIITLVDEFENPNEIAINLFEKFVSAGKIVGSSTVEEENQTNPNVYEIISQASQSELESTNQKVKFVRDFINGFESKEISARTLRDWKSKYQKAEIEFGKGYGYLGLIPKKRPGNSNSKISQKSKDLLLKFIEEDYETIIQKNITAVYNSYFNECQNQFIQPASFKTFCVNVKKQDMEKQVRKRQGKRAAYQHEKFYWELEMTTPRHGERPFHIAHIDHTELDIELVDSETNENMGRPWLTLMIDAYSRRILAAYLTFDSPSYRSNLMAMRECVRRHGRLPQILVVDGGKEFSSTYFETFLAMFEVTKKTRPPAKARFGTLIERMFGTTNTMFINNLQGNTQMTKNVRQMTKSVNPKNHSIWTLSNLYGYLCEFLYEVYDQKEHSTLNQPPKEAFAKGLLKSGKRQHLLIPFDENFLLLTLPTTQKGTAKVDASRGVKINRIYYWCDEFRHPEVAKTNIPIKYDPWNLGIAYAYVNKRWHKCISEHYSILKGHSEKEVKTATEEIKKKQKNASVRTEISAKKIADFLQNTEATEKVLKQRITDRELSRIHSQINFGKLPEPNNSPILAEVSEEIKEGDKNAPANVVVPFLRNEGTAKDKKTKKKHTNFVIYDRL